MLQYTSLHRASYAAPKLKPAPRRSLYIIDYKLTNVLVVVSSLRSCVSQLLTYSFTGTRENRI